MFGNVAENGSRIFYGNGNFFVKNILYNYVGFDRILIGEKFSN
jgi:hypothetical protein